MPSVVIDGVQYSPITEPTARIGIALTTRDRPEILARSLRTWMQHLPENAVLVVVDDHSDAPATVPDGVTLVRARERLGIARAKNLAITTLMDAGCTDLFLVDDDVLCTSADWWKAYVASPEPHLAMSWDNEIFTTDSLIGYQWPKGCMLYVERRVVERVGGMDPNFGVWGLEHVSWSDRIHNAGFTTCRYQDIPGSDKLFISLDRTGEAQTSVPLSDRLAANTGLLAASHYSDVFIPYRETRPRARFDLSVLVPSVHTRRGTFLPKILDQLYGQYEALPKRDQERVEILTLIDAKGISLGDKRNRMVSIAQGEYIIHVDDDDRIEPDYLSALLAATEDGNDAITFRASVRLNGGAAKPCIYSIRYVKDENTSTEYHRLPNHITAVRRDLAIKAGFPNKRKGEDSAYSAALRPLLESETHIDRVLYHYDYSDKTTETQKDADAVTAPIVDVVFLSKATTPELRDMCQHAIDTCIAGAGDHTVNVVVIEQAGARYRDAITIHETGDFNYNEFGNIGAATGSAPWIMIANSDLDFEPGWLDALLDAKHDLVSPVDKNEGRQNRLTNNETGTQCGQHLSGWCFMMSRSFWEKIGGLDRDFRFWCADNSLIEQALAVGVKPMVVPKARVTHLISQTIGGRGKAQDPDDDGSMTWQMVRLFNKKYGKNLFNGDARYRAWQAKHPE